MIVLDTSILIGGLTGSRHCGSALLRVLDQGERILLPSLVLYEWLRGPRTLDQIVDQENLFSAATVLPFEVEDARISAEIYRAVPRARSREIDIAIAACAIRREAELWTLNPRDFADIPRLRLTKPPSV